jgi:hypothetical protein
MIDYLLKPQKLLPAVLIFYACFNTYAQEIASASVPVHARSYNKSEQYKPLKKVLSEFEYFYDIHFNFATSLVEDKVVSSHSNYFQSLSTSKEEDMEKNLQTLLKPFDLKYKKVGNNIYGIYSDRPFSSIEKKSSEQDLERLSLLQFKNSRFKNLEIPIKGKVTSDDCC